MGEKKEETNKEEVELEERKMGRKFAVSKR